MIETTTYTELQRCKYCLEHMMPEDALDSVHNDCLSNEKLNWICNDPECGHCWHCLGIPAMCPVCWSFNVDSTVNKRLTDLRVDIISKRIQKERAA